ncbi:MAG: hypothetical protein ACXABO_10755 [Promethearchaeota archaeon]
MKHIQTAILDLQIMIIVLELGSPPSYKNLFNNGDIDHTFGICTFCERFEE